MCPWSGVIGDGRRGLALLRPIRHLRGHISDWLSGRLAQGTIHKVWLALTPPLSPLTPVSVCQFSLSAGAAVVPSRSDPLPPPLKHRFFQVKMRRLPGAPDRSFPLDSLISNKIPLLPITTSSTRLIVTPSPTFVCSWPSASVPC